MPLARFSAIEDEVIGEFLRSCTVPLVREVDEKLALMGTGTFFRLELRQYLGEVFRKLALQKESRIEQGHLMPDHVHMMISIPPKYAVSPVSSRARVRSTWRGRTERGSATSWGRISGPEGTSSRP